VIKDVSGAEVKVEIRSKAQAAAGSKVQIVVAQAFLKERKMDNLLRQLCELGITKWIPFSSERSVSRPDAKRLNARAQRWKQIAIESFKQCRRSVLPQIAPTMPYEEVLTFGKFCDLKFVFWENETRRLNRVLPSKPDKGVETILIILGPEGGFSAGEIEKARACGFEIAGLGPRILRAETATIAACALIQYIYGDMGEKNLDKQKRFE